MLAFTVIERHEQKGYNPRNTAVLIKDNWDDWGIYNTQYYLVYFDNRRDWHEIGYVKIGCPVEELINKRPPVSRTFQALEPQFFSLGQSDNYYLNLRKLDSIIAEYILSSLNDIVFQPSYFEKNKTELVMTESLQRYVSDSTILGQFTNILNGGDKLSNYRFSCSSVTESVNVNIDFNVIPDSFPPTNIHTLIGNNGVGKSYILKAMVRSLRFNEGDVHLAMKGDDTFANLIAVSFSAFENFDNQGDNVNSRIKYAYIGLNKNRPETEAVVHYRQIYPDDKYELGFDFIMSLQACKYSPKKELWQGVIDKFNWNDTTQSILSELVNSESVDDNKAVLEHDSIRFFNSLSSGHKIVLLTLTSLVEKIEEKSLVLFDEPEVHLHPPMLSSLITALSYLLKKTNGVAILATHSPVVLQEVPASCVSVLRRPGSVTKSLKPGYETFGENVSLLTHLVFGLDNTNSGYVELLKRKISQGYSFDEIMTASGGQLGSEAITILASLSHSAGS